METFKLADSRLLLTGASSGIGRELARELGARGAELAISARRRSLLESLAKEIWPRPATHRRSSKRISPREAQRKRPRH